MTVGKSFVPQWIRAEPMTLRYLLRSRLPFVSSQVCLALRGFSRIRQTASGRVYTHQETTQATVASRRKAA
ncbi:hypothetical protein NDA03_27360 [Trichocoleus sp. Lan]